jgi:hypothetical protein
MSIEGGSIQMKVAYVAGKYRGKNDFEVSENIYAARLVAAELWRKGVPQ